MKARIGKELTAEQKEAILHRWRTSQHNQIKAIAEEFNCSKNQVHKIINKYLYPKIRS